MTGQNQLKHRSFMMVAAVILLFTFSFQQLIFASPQDPDGLENDTEESTETPQKKPTTPAQSPEKRKEALMLLKHRILYSASTDRRNAIRDLRRIDKNDQPPFFDDLVLIIKTDSDATVREAAMRFLAEEQIDTKAAKEAYIAGLDDAERNVQIEALKGIRRIKLKEAGDKLVKLVSESSFNENDAVVHSAIRTLGTLEYQSESLSKTFIDALDKPETEMETRRSIILYLGAVRTDSPALSTKLNSIATDSTADLVMRSYSANALGKMAAKDSPNSQAGTNRTSYIKSMQDILREIKDIKDARQRSKMNMLKQQAILALIRMGDDSVKPELQSAAQDDDANTRYRAIHYIGELKLKEFKELVEFKSKHDESPKVRKEAERVLKEL